MKDKSAKILLDVPVDDGVLGFDNYRDALNSIIKSSDPHFTIGIFGGWGTGKTTLMKMMRKQLDDEEEITVWFDPWQYEKEEHLIVSLLQTVKLELKNRKLIKTQTARNLGKTALALASGFSGRIPVIGIDVSAKDAIDTYQKLFESKDLSSVYFDLNEQLSKLVLELKEEKKNRIVIFIDDLDRCLPDKALQVLESVKTFLDKSGYVFVVGVSREIIEKCVDAKYEKKSGITGTQYIRKMIQVPFTLPELRDKEIAEYVKRLKNEIQGSEVEEHVADYFDIIVKGLEPNPREIKRFINNFILAYRISEKETDPDKLLALLIIQFRWDGFYRNLARYKKPFLEETREILKTWEKLKEEDEAKQAKEKWNLFDLIQDDLKDEEFRNFLEGVGKILFEVTDLDPYIHFSKSVQLEKEEPKTEFSREGLVDLLRHSKIDEFNTVRPYPNVELGPVHLVRTALKEADLSGCDLRGANLRGADLREASLRKADLRGVKLREAFLRGANLSGANLASADLAGADLGWANLSDANLCGANLAKAELGRAQVHHILVDTDTVFDDTTLPGVNVFPNRIRANLRLEMKDGFIRATTKRLPEESKSDGMK